MNDTRAPQQPASDPCPDCNGSGERMQSTWGHGPDDYEYPVDCKTCDGTGAAPAAQQPAEPPPEQAIRDAIDDFVLGGESLTSTIAKLRAALATEQGDRNG